MSTKSTLFLTQDNEHCYSDCSISEYDETGKWIGDPITIEFDNKNLVESYIDEDCTVVVIRPNTEIHKLVGRMDVEHPKPVEQPTRAELIRDLKIANKKILELEACIKTTSIIQDELHNREK